MTLSVLRSERLQAQAHLMMILRSLSVLATVILLTACGTNDGLDGEDMGSDEAASKASDVSDTIFEGGEGYDSYRIPAIVTAPDGSLLAFAEGRKTSSKDYGNITSCSVRGFRTGRKEPR